MRTFFVAILVVVCSVVAFAQTADSIRVTDVTNRVKKGFRVANNRKIDIVVLHSTYYVNKDTFSLDGVLKQFANYGVSAHYIIGRDGEIFRAVDEKNVAFHAGVSLLPNTNRRNLNSNSIGIEIINTPYNVPTDAQYAAVTVLVKDIRSRYKINYIVGHKDIAPGRKTDPWSFDWERFWKNMKEE